MNHISMIRAMANTLCDHDVEATDHAAAVGALVIAGFPMKDIQRCLSDAMLMAAIRQRNERRAG